MTIKNILDTIDMRELGRELQQARKKAGLTQEDAASVIAATRTTITAIEKGERRLRAEELVKLARAYNRQVSDFVRQRPSIEPLQVQFRGPTMRSAEDNERVAPYVQQLEELARDYAELEDLTGSALVQRYPIEYSIHGISIEQAAEEVATQERHRLGLGDGPIPVLRDILEQEVGLRIFYLSLPAHFSAMYFYEQRLGGCIGVNIDHPEERRRMSLSHDYGHFLVHRYQPSLLVVDGYDRRPQSERFADLFALHFLLPTSSVMRRFNDVRRTKSKVTPADLCILAHYYGVSVEGFTRRLEGMKVVPTGTWERLRAGGFKVREAQQQLGLAPLPARDTPLPLRYQYLVLDVFDRELITEGHFAHLLRIDRLEARQLAEILREETPTVGVEGISLGLDMAQPLEVQEDSVGER